MTRGPATSFRKLYLLFFFSGMSGLLYESIWSRYIRQFVGSAATAQVLVLALFMGGMSMGAMVAGRWSTRLRSPIFVYGLIEGVVGLYALLFPYLHAAIFNLCYDVLFPAVGAGVWVSWIKWSMASVLILPPCVLLGMTFPIMSSGILRQRPERSGEILSLLYFTNSFGASIGALLSGFVLVAHLGLVKTLWVAAGINITILLVAVRERAALEPLWARDDGGARLSRSGLIFLAVAFGTGCSSFMYEIGWIRLLSMIVGSATHSFEVMLSAFVFGLALGGLWVRRRMDRFKDPVVTLGLVQLVMGVSAVLTLPLYFGAVEGLAAFLNAAEGRSQGAWYLFNILRYVICLLIMLPATFCAGMTLPLLTHVMLKRGEPEGAVGTAYGTNTFGAISGALLAGLVLMPVVGLKGVIWLGALIDVALGVLIFGKERAFRMVAGVKRLLSPREAWLVVVGAAIVMLAGLLVPIDPRVLASSVFRNGETELNYRLDVLSYVDGRSASVIVAGDADGQKRRIVFTNGKPDASVVLDRYPDGPGNPPLFTPDEPTQLLLSLFSYAALPAAQEVALIGFGSGVSCHALLASPHLTSLETIEIEPEMVRAGRFFRPNNARCFDDPRNHFHFDDAKAFFASAGQRYDLILSEPTNPWVSGVASLFTIEFYQQAKRYLHEDGLFVQWLQGYEVNDDLQLLVLAALDDEFSDYAIYRIGGADWIILASPHGKVPPFGREVFSWDKARDHFSLLGIRREEQARAMFVANRTMLHPYVKDLPANTDEHPLLDTRAEKSRFTRGQAQLLFVLRDLPGDFQFAATGTRRQSYPLVGIADHRDPSILIAPERAAHLLRAFEERDQLLHKKLNVQLMDEWLALSASPASLQQGDASKQWLDKTYEIYELATPYFDLEDHPWWARVVELGAGLSPDIQEALRLMGAANAGAFDQVAALVDTDGAKLLPQWFIQVQRHLAAVALHSSLDGAPNLAGLSDGQRLALSVMRSHLGAQ